MCSLLLLVDVFPAAQIVTFTVCALSSIDAGGCYGFSDVICVRVYVECTSTFYFISSDYCIENRVLSISFFFSSSIMGV